MPVAACMKEHEGEKLLFCTFAGNITPEDSAALMPEGLEIIRENGLSSAIFDMREQSNTLALLDIYEQHTMLATLLPPGFTIIVLDCPEQREYNQMAVDICRQVGLDYVVIADEDEAMALATGQKNSGSDQRENADLGVS